MDRDGRDTTMVLQLVLHERERSAELGPVVDVSCESAVELEEELEAQVKCGHIECPRPAVTLDHLGRATSTSQSREPDCPARE